MNTYILLKDLPELKAGQHLTNYNSFFYYPSPIPGGKLVKIKTDVVENNPEWFKKKEDPKPIDTPWDDRELKIKQYVTDFNKILSSQPSYHPDIEDPQEHNEFIDCSVLKEEVKKVQAERPPIGIMPEYIWVEQRVKELYEAIVRSNYSNCEAWIEEWNRHVSWLINRKK